MIEIIEIEKWQILNTLIPGWKCGYHFEKGINRSVASNAWNIKESMFHSQEGFFWLIIFFLDEL